MTLSGALFRGVSIGGAMRGTSIGGEGKASFGMTSEIGGGIG